MRDIVNMRTLVVMPIQMVIPLQMRMIIIVLPVTRRQLRAAAVLKIISMSCATPSRLPEVAEQTL